jgi:hypothetical protein
MEQVVCFLQGVLAQAKNGDELFSKKFHAANGKAQTCSQGALISFLLRGGGGRGFKFSMGSYQVPNMFLNMLSIAPHFLSHMLRQMLSSFHLYRWFEREKLLTSQQNLLF